MPDHVILGKLTRREFRDALESGKYQTGVIPIGSIEQHIEHLAMEHDTASVSHVAEEAARRLYPQVIVTVPMNVGISEHHMVHKGTVTAKPGSWLSVLFDAAESLARHGVKNILLLNGHGGNVRPVDGIIDQWRLFFKVQHPDVTLAFTSYWDLMRDDVVLGQMTTDHYPGHAQEFETAFALALWPENVRPDAMKDQKDKEPLEATAETGKILVEEAISQTADFLERFIKGEIDVNNPSHHP
jgi:creatinine amidohydrolase